MFALTTASAWAEDNNWTGAAGDNLFKTDGNWSTGSRPASDTLYFDSNNFDANFTANEIVFDNAYVNNGCFTIQRVGASDSPLVLRATDPSYGLTCGTASAGSYIGKNNGSAYLMISNGTWNTGSTARNMTVGSNNKSWLKLKDVRSFSIDQLNMNNGSTVVIEDSVLAVAKVTKDSVGVNNTLRFEGGTLRATRDEASEFIQNASYLKLAVGEKGGTIDNGGYNITMGKLLGDVDGTGPLHLTGDGTTTLGNTLIKNGKIVVDGGTVSASALHICEDTGNDGYVEVNGGTLSVPNDIYMGHANNSTATLTINGGMVEVDSNYQLLSANATGSHGTINLNGGVLRAKRIAHRYGSCIINFNGGTLQANATNTDFIKSGTTVNVDLAGGTIDNGGSAITIPAALSGSGSFTFKGAGTTKLSGSVENYSGVTRVAAGSTLCVSKDIATKLLANGLMLAGAPKQGTSYTILTSSSASDDWSSFNHSKVTCPVASAISTKIGDDGKSIVVTVTELKSGNVWTGANDNNMSDADNWLEGVVPLEGDDIDLSAATTIHADLDRTFRSVTMGEGVVTFTGKKMKAKSFTDTSKVAVGAKSIVTVEGELSISTEKSNRNICHWVGDDGKFEVTENIKLSWGHRTLNPCVESVGTGVVAAKGLVNDAAQDGCFRLVRNIAGYRANWLIGANGLSGNKTFAVSDDKNVTAKISAASDFKISKGVDVNQFLELDTADNTVTIEANYNGTGAMTFSGSGTVAVESDVNLGTSAITLGARTTLELTATSSQSEKLISNTLNLPTGEGEKATIRINGTRLRSGDHDHVIATLGNDATTTNVELDGNSVALGGRKATLRVDGDELILNIKPSGFLMIIR